jgi:hypothetical protein
MGRDACGRDRTARCIDWNITRCIHESTIADMKKTRLAVLAFIPLLFMSASSAVPADGQDLVGRWKRVKENGEWVMYDYRRDGTLLRATDSQHAPLAFGKYRLADDVIHFQESPENYTPVRFAIEKDQCSGHTGITLFLYDRTTGHAYGCYFKLDPSARASDP